MSFVAKTWARLVFAGLLAAATLATQAHAARRIAVDLNTRLIAPCTFGSTATCNPFDVGFNMFGRQGPNTNIFIYSNGLVSIDHPLDAAAPANLLDLGGNVMAAAFLPAVPATWSVLAEQGYADTDEEGGDIPNTNREFRIDWYPDVTIAAPNPGPVQMRIIKDCSRVPSCSYDGKGVYVLYGYGGLGAVCCDPEEVSHPALLPVGSQIGIDVPNQQQRVVITSQTDLKNYEFTYFFPSVVPEPATWMQLVAGFLIVASLLRRGRRRPLPQTVGQLT